MTRWDTPRFGCRPQAAGRGRLLSGRLSGGFRTQLPCFAWRVRHAQEHDRILYHQDTYLDFATDAEIWASIWEGHDEANRSRLISQLKGVLGESDAQVLRMWNADAHSHNFVEASDAREFLMAMLAFFEGRA